MSYNCSLFFLDNTGFRKIFRFSDSLDSGASGREWRERTGDVGNVSISIWLAFFYLGHCVRDTIYFAYFIVE